MNKQKQSTFWILPESNIQQALHSLSPVPPESTGVVEQGTQEAFEIHSGEDQETGQ